MDEVYPGRSIMNLMGHGTESVVAPKDTSIVGNFCRLFIDCELRSTKESRFNEPERARFLRSIVVEPMENRR